jgi:hypothetical protein
MGAGYMRPGLAETFQITWKGSNKSSEQVVSSVSTQITVKEIRPRRIPFPGTVVKAPLSSPVRTIYPTVQEMARFSSDSHRSICACMS